MTSGANCYLYREFPPSGTDMIAKIGALKLQAKIYQPPFYSNEADISERSREFAGLVYHLKGGKGTAFLEEFMPVSESAQSSYNYPRFEVHSGWEFASFPPSRKVTRQWLKYEMVFRKKFSNRKTPRSQVRFHLLTSRSVSNRPPDQIEGPTQFRHSPLTHAIKVSREQQNMTIMCLEVVGMVVLTVSLSIPKFGVNVAPAFGKAVPDPEFDSICIAIYGLQVVGTRDIHTGIVAIQNVQLNPKRIRDFPLDFVDTELDLLNRISDIVAEFDPDILTGWDVQRTSWGYLNSRAKQYGALVLVYWLVC